MDYILTEIDHRRVRFASLGLGIINWYTEKDRYDNEVSIICMPYGLEYRMVHHKSRGYYEYATIYAGRNKFMRFRFLEGKSDTHGDVLQLGNYEIFYGDGEVVSVTSDENGSNINSILRNIEQTHEAYHSLFILNVLLHNQSDDIWQMKNEKGEIVQYIAQ
jgi:hypothetical protein